MDGFTVDLCYLAREELIKLRNRCLAQKFNRKTRAFDEQLDENKFLVEYVKAVIKGWKGLKYSYLEELLLVDISSLDPEDYLEFSLDNAETLMRNAADFDTWVTEVTGELENFTKTK
jgi:hypothetical protein